MITNEALDRLVDPNDYTPAALLGIDIFDDEEVLNGFLGKLSPMKRLVAASKLIPKPAASKGSRAEMEARLHELPVHIRKELSQHKVRLGDQVIYSLKPVGGSKTIKFFETQDDKEVGLRNISNAKLPKNQAMVVSGIWLLQGKAPAATAGSPTSDEIKATPFTSIERVPALMNGEFQLKANKIQLVPETSCRVFVTDSNHNIHLGYYKLDNPRVVADDVQLEFILELGTTLNIPQDTYMYVGLAGTITTP